MAKLLVSGAAPALKTDPTPKDTAGRTAADLALANGFAGIAACLAEAALESRLSAMTLAEDGSGGSKLKPATVEAINFEQLQRRSEDVLLHESSVIAVKKATEAAAAIQALKRQHSLMRLRHLAESQVLENKADFQSINEQIRAWKAARVIQQAYRGHHRKRSQKQQSAAIVIQRRYRGYKGRKDFLNIRRKVVRIQVCLSSLFVRLNVYSGCELELIGCMRFCLTCGYDMYLSGHHTASCFACLDRPMSEATWFGSNTGKYFGRLGSWRKLS